jgi:hypothetical protein
VPKITDTKSDNDYELYKYQQKIIILIMFVFTTLIFAIENDDFDIRASKYDARTRLVNATISNRAYNIDFKEAVFELIGYDERSRPIRIKYLYIKQTRVD